MDGLRPERDELDRFQERSSGVTASKKSKPKKAVENDKSQKQAGNSGLPLFIGCFALTLVLFAFLGWAYLEQKRTVDALNKDLSEALAFINQSKLSMARLEGELNEAGAEIEQAGSSATKQLKFLDSEMRKLWGVAGDKNRKAIAANKDRVDSVKLQLNALKNKDLKPLEASVAKQEQMLKQLEVRLGNSQAMADQIGLIKKQSANVASELSLTRESLEQSVAELARNINSQPNNSKAVAENTESIASINASRRQVNERIVGLERQLNELKLAVLASKSPSTSQN